MEGTIQLKSLEEVAIFLAAFSNTGATDIFEVRFVSNRFVSNGVGYEIRFNGGK